MLFIKSPLTAHNHPNTLEVVIYPLEVLFEVLKANNKLLCPWLKFNLGFKNNIGYFTKFLSLLIVETLKLGDTVSKLLNLEN